MQASSRTEESSMQPILEEFANPELRSEQLRDNLIAIKMHTFAHNEINDLKDELKIKAE